MHTQKQEKKTKYGNNCKSLYSLAAYRLFSCYIYSANIIAFHSIKRSAEFLSNLKLPSCVVFDFIFT